MGFMQGAREEVSNEIETLGFQIIDYVSGGSRKYKEQVTIFKNRHKYFQNICLQRLC